MIIGQPVENLFFRDATETKTYPGGVRRQVYMIYLLFRCRAVGEDVRLNDEFECHSWVSTDELDAYDTNPATRETFSVLKGFETE